MEGWRTTFIEGAQVGASMLDHRLLCCDAVVSNVLCSPGGPKEVAKRILLVLSGAILVLLGLFAALYVGLSSFRAFERHDWLMFIALFLSMQAAGLLLLYAGIRLMRRR